MDRSFVIDKKEFNQKFGGLEPFGKFLEDAIAFNCDMYGGGNVRCEVSDWGAEFFFTGSPFDDDATDELILSFLLQTKPFLLLSLEPRV